MKKIVSLLLSMFLLFSLVGCGDNEEKNQNQEPNQEEQQEEQQEEKQKENKEEKKDEKKDEYVPDKWIKDNLSISFYMIYAEGQDNELYTLNICGDDALMLSQKEGGDKIPGTYYKQTDTGIETYTLIGENALKSPIKEGTFKDNLYKIMMIMGTFGRRAESEYKFENYDKKSGEYIGRNVYIYESKSATSNTTIIIDKETGIVLKEQSVLKYNDKEQIITPALVTEFKYGDVTPEDASVNLEDYKITES